MKEELLDQIAVGIKKTVKADATAIYLLNEETKQLKMVEFSGSRDIAFKPLPVDHPLTQNALSGEITIIPDTSADPRTLDLADTFNSLLCLPLQHQDKPLGIIYVYFIASKKFGEEEFELIQPLVNVGAEALGVYQVLDSQECIEENQVKFINIATHELRSPITVSQSLVRGILKGYAGEMNTQQENLFKRVNSSLNYLENLVNDLLDMAASQTSQAYKEKVPVLLNVAIGQAVLLLQPKAEDKNIHLTYHAHPKKLLVLGTEEGLGRIFTNLIGNAIKYTPPEGEVNVYVKEQGNEIQIDVADTGIGIPKESLPQLFDEFYRAPNAQKSDVVGTGLGLSIVKSLVEGYGGDIQVSSKVGEGTTFTLTLSVV